MIATFVAAVFAAVVSLATDRRAQAALLAGLLLGPGEAAAGWRTPA